MLCHAHVCTRLQLFSSLRCAGIMHQQGLCVTDDLCQGSACRVTTTLYCFNVCSASPLCVLVESCVLRIHTYAGTSLRRLSFAIAIVCLEQWVLFVKQHISHHTGRTLWSPGNTASMNRTTTIAALTCRTCTHATCTARLGVTCTNRDPALLSMCHVPQ